MLLHYSYFSFFFAGELLETLRKRLVIFSIIDHIYKEALWIIVYVNSHSVSSDGTDVKPRFIRWKLAEQPVSWNQWCRELNLWSLNPPLQRSWKGDIRVSPCPSVCPSIHLSVRLWTESCPLCIFNNTHQIRFIFAHLIKQIQKVCSV